MITADEGWGLFLDFFGVSPVLSVLFLSPPLWEVARQRQKKKKKKKKKRKSLIEPSKLKTTNQLNPFNP